MRGREQPLEREQELGFVKGWGERAARTHVSGGAAAAHNHHCHFTAYQVPASSRVILRGPYSGSRVAVRPTVRARKLRSYS